MTNIVAIANQKGGVGKTSLTLHVAGALAETGRKVLAVDIDLQANLSSIFIDDINNLTLTINDVLNTDSDINPSQAIYVTRFNRLFIMPGNQKLRGLETRLAAIPYSEYLLLDALNEVKSEYDFILIDCPTGINKPVWLALVAADWVIIPTECLPESVQGINQILNFMARLRRQADARPRILGIMINKYDSRLALQQSYRDQLRKSFEELAFTTEFRNKVKYAEAMTCRLPITSYDPESEEAAMAMKLTGEIEGRIDRILRN